MEHKRNRIAKNMVAYFRDFLWKYSEIDPTNRHNSAHPMDIDGVPSFNLQQADDETVSTVSINEITTRHFIRLRDSALDFVGRKVTGAVITVPPVFSDTQNEALVATAKAAELEVLRIIHEPMAAVFVYTARQTPRGQGVDKNILVADLGGTRCDAALKLNEVLLDHFSKEFIKKQKVDPGNERSLAKLRLEADGTKRTLSLGTSPTISIESLADGYDFHSTVNRLRYKLSAKKVFAQIVPLVENVVKTAELDPLDISEVILSGGTSHTPKIASHIAALPPDPVPVNAPETLTTVLNLSELSAHGAAIQASLIAEFDKEDIEQSTLSVVTVAPHLSHPIGVIIGEDNSFRAMLEAQTATPAWRIAQFDVQSGGDVIVRICGVNGEKAEDDSEEEGEDDEEEEEEECNRVLKVHKVIAEAAIKGAKKSGKVEVTIKVGLNLDLNVAVRVVGTQIGVRGEVKPDAGSAQ
ncbi:actin-like ATPase domain-containing protein [Choiromyces venosus 120613-1]|uniref:Actin-like ATPase domain-containing protein n=1 Tax=Choiromyces venosus 120613-1 TaxID=1336337 RepID=A0A3N4J4H4_9PEZI|nr:actin-like ATPase domain-containing protein [Choiromyces venosus 120613-1]